MKLFVTVLVLVAVAYSQAELTAEQKKLVQGYKVDCLSSSGANPAAALKAKKGVFTEDAKLKEFLFCLAKKVGILNEAGEFQMDVIRKKIGAQIGADETERVLKACASKTYGSGPETSYQVSKCYWDQRHESLI